MSRFPLWMWLLVTFGTNVAQAQTPGTPVEGQRVRVAHGCEIARDQPIECRERRSLRVETGQFRALDGDTLRMRAQSTDAEVAIPTAYVTQVWVADGSRTHFSVDRRRGGYSHGLRHPSVGRRWQQDTLLGRRRDRVARRCAHWRRNRLGATFRRWGLGLVFDVQYCMRRCTRRRGWVPPRRRRRCADQVRPVASSAGQSSPPEPGTATGCPRTKGLGRLLGPNSASIWSASNTLAPAGGPPAS